MTELPDEMNEPMDVDLSLTSEKSFSASEEKKGGLTPNKLGLRAGRRKSNEKKAKRIQQSSPKLTHTQPDSVDVNEKKPLIGKVKMYHYEKAVAKSSFCKDTLTYIFIPLALTAIFIFYSLKCCSLNISQIEIKLNEKLHGQEDAAQQIIDTLQNEHQTKIMFFYGGTGVGKTYAASLILHGEWNCTNVYHYTMPSYKEHISSNPINFGFCMSAFIVVDDLTADSDIIKSVDTVVNKSIAFKANLTLVLIYNCDIRESEIKSNCDDTFKTKLENSFSNINALKVFIKFKSLENGHLRKCIEDTKGKIITNQEFEEFSKNFDVASDGCKGVGSKIKFLTIKV